MDITEMKRNWENLSFLDGLKGLYKENIAMHLESDVIQFMDGYDQGGKWAVYILRCGDGSLYVGITNNIVKRLKTHRSGKGAKYTRGRLPIVLDAFHLVESKSEALKLEYKIKQMKKEDKLDYLRSLHFKDESKSS